MARLHNITSGLSRFRVIAGLDRDRPTQGTVFVDGHEILGVRRVEVVVDFDEVPTLRLEILPGEVEVCAEGVAEAPAPTPGPCGHPHSYKRAGIPLVAFCGKPLGHDGYHVDEKSGWAWHG